MKTLIGQLLSLRDAASAAHGCRIATAAASGVTKLIFDSTKITRKDLESQLNEAVDRYGIEEDVRSGSYFVTIYRNSKILES